MVRTVADTATLAEFQNTSGTSTWVKKFVTLVTKAAPKLVLPPMISIEVLVELISIQKNGNSDRKAATPRKTYCRPVLRRRDEFMSAPSRHRTEGTRTLPPSARQHRRASPRSRSSA